MKKAQQFLAAVVFAALASPVFSQTASPQQARTVSRSAGSARSPTAE